MSTSHQKNSLNCYNVLKALPVQLEKELNVEKNAGGPRLILNFPVGPKKRCLSWE
jgi:hypothetical protein